LLTSGSSYQKTEFESGRKEPEGRLCPKKQIHAFQGLRTDERHVHHRHFSDALRGSAADIQSIQIPYRRHADQDADAPARHPVVVVGAGPVGLSLAIDLAQRGQPVVVLDNDCKLSTGSRAICFSKRTLEIWDRLGVGQPMVDKGVSWNLGKVFARDQSLYQFDLLPEAGHERPAFINLQQYYAEAYLVERALQLPLIDLRWHNKVTALAPRDDGAG
jgi:3-(3-hydroxy-phenyl)propionate hydroxylase